ncbi:MAG: type III pantothenate kinase, partial [bacterium]|nr:type III pantothenate kinase [bacterium]
SYVRMVERRLGIQPRVITAENQKILRVDYDPPSSVGSDRLCGGAAAFTKYGGPVVVIDMGTATVFDFVSKQGVYRGGLIAPGIATAAESLHHSAAMLPQVDYAFPTELIGRTTESSIQSGILNGAVAMIDGIVENIRQQEKIPVHVIATGGFAALLAAHSRVIQHVEPDLVLRGIQIITAHS